MPKHLLLYQYMYIIHSLDLLLCNQDVYLMPLCSTKAITDSSQHWIFFFLQFMYNDIRCCTPVTEYPCCYYHTVNLRTCSVMSIHSGSEPGSCCDWVQTLDWINKPNSSQEFLFFLKYTRLYLTSDIKGPDSIWNVADTKKICWPLNF